MPSRTSVIICATISSTVSFCAPARVSERRSFSSENGSRSPVDLRIQGIDAGSVVIRLYSFEYTMPLLAHHATTDAFCTSIQYDRLPRGNTERFCKYHDRSILLRSHGDGNSVTVVAN